MKHILLILAIVSTALVQQVRALTLLPYLEPIRTEILNQQVIVSNTVPLDKPLATALRKAMTALDRIPATSLVTETKTLATLAKTLSKTSLSNTFDPLIRTAINSYLGESSDALIQGSNTLYFARPSGPHTAALNTFAQIRDTIDSAGSQQNLPLFANVLAFVGKKLVVYEKLIIKALNAPAGPNSLQATFTASSEGTFTFTPKPRISLNGVYTPANHNLAIATTMVDYLGNKTVRTRILTIVIPDLPEGTTTLNVGTSASVLYVTGTLTATIPPVVGFSETYDPDVGTITITHNSTTKNVFGTFTFAGSGSVNDANSVAADGSFNVTYKTAN